MKAEIDAMRARCRALARERRLGELARVPGAPPYRTTQDFLAGQAPSARTLTRLEQALDILEAQDGAA